MRGGLDEKETAFYGVFLNTTKVSIIGANGYDTLVNPFFFWGGGQNLGGGLFGKASFQKMLYSHGQKA